MERLIVDAGLRERFGRRGREIVLAEFDEKMVLDRTLEVYEELYEAGTRDVGRGTRES
jgi:hypothetical protein